MREKEAQADRRFGVQGLRLRVECSGSRLLVEGSGLRVQGLNHESEGGGGVREEERRPLERGGGVQGRAEEEGHQGCP